MNVRLINVTNSRSVVINRKKEEEKETWKEKKRRRRKKGGNGRWNETHRGLGSLIALIAFSQGSKSRQTSFQARLEPREIRSRFVNDTRLDFSKRKKKVFLSSNWKELLSFFLSLSLCIFLFFFLYSVLLVLSSLLFLSKGYACLCFHRGFIGFIHSGHWWVRKKRKEGERKKERDSICLTTTGTRERKNDRGKHWPTLPLNHLCECR